MESVDVSIIIVNYNTKELTLNCLHSVFEQTNDISFEVIVSDNGSTDGSVEKIKSEYPKVILLENNANLGFGKANNRGLDIAKGKYIFYLNSDTILLNNAVKFFFDFWENYDSPENLGILGCWLLSKDMKPAKSFGSFPTYDELNTYLTRAVISQYFRKYYIWLKKFIKRNISEQIIQSQIEIDGFITGADNFLLNNNNARFDESFFMYFEETDMQFNHFHLEGKKSIILDTPKIIHLEGGSEKDQSAGYNFSKLTNIFFWISAIKYCKKNKLCSEKQLLKLKKRIIKIWKLQGKRIPENYFQELYNT
ncbi:MAG: glycosyltransferase family 2 protein [Treponema sp.]|nr:glycosyltransferase family 2 protein [Treponema sp.]